MKQQRTNTIPINKTREKKLQKNMFAIIAGLAIINLLVYYFEPLIIGHNTGYIIYFFGIPVILGIVFLGYYRRIFLLKKYSELITVGEKILGGGFFLLQGIFFSYLSFGLLGEVAWIACNKMAAASNPTTTIRCKVSAFSHEKSGRYRSSHLNFTFQGRQEHFNISYQLYNEYKNDNPKNYEVEIEGQKGMWNYFVVNNWSFANTGN
jgi:hypothetical protein